MISLVTGFGCVVALAGCLGSGSPAPVAVPTGSATRCAELHQALPDQLDGRDRRETTPDSVRTAAWGTPSVVLRCGVPKPAGLVATAAVIEVDGVEWFLSEPAPQYVFTTVGRRARVEVRVPSSVPRSAATAPLVDLAGAVKEHDPRSDGGL